jgi:uncharacterized membrane protein YkoI
MKRHVTPIAVGAALLMLGAAAPAPALAQDRPAAVRQVPLSRVLAMIAQRTPGRQLNTTMGDSGGRPAYIIQWQRTDGRVVVITVDAETGQIIG